jgi:peptidoglycan/xylan/chitin deacetylase (PgdA/CDA1 family)
MRLASLALVATLAVACGGGDAAPTARTPNPAPTVGPTVMVTARATSASATASPTALAASTAAPQAPRPVPPAEVERGNLDRRELALTFDCGGHARGTAEILAALRDADVHVTFFMIGDWVRAYPDLAREIAARHEVANHSDHHPDYVELTDAQIVADLDAADRTFIEVLGRSARPMWRAPSGSRDARVLATAARGGWTQHVFWTMARDAQGNLVTGDSGDWRDFTPRQVADNMLRAAALGNGVITVSHCDSTQTRESLPEVLRELHARGIRVTTVSDVLR